MTTERQILAIKRTVLALAAALVLLVNPAIAGDEVDAGDGDSSGFLFPITLFQRFVSPADGDRCPLYPSCSAYGKSAFSKHGPLMGWIMTSDRLLRCGRDEVRQGRTTRIDGDVRTYDPVANNDFWWK